MFHVNAHYTNNCQKKHETFSAKYFGKAAYFCGHWKIEICENESSFLST